MLLILDSSVATKWFVPEKHKAEADAILQLFHAGQVEFLAPEVVRPEVANALRHHRYDRDLTTSQALDAWADFLKMPIPIVPIPEILDEAVALAFQYNGGVMDALFVTLAVRNKCKFVTADERTTKAFGPLGCCVYLTDFRAWFSEATAG